MSRWSTIRASCVDRTMLSLRDGGWARSVRGVGNRAFKHKHVIDERLGLSEAEQALSRSWRCVGRSRPGELCTRTERYGVFPGDRDEVFAAVEDTLAALTGRDEPLVRNVGRGIGAVARSVDSVARRRGRLGRRQLEPVLRRRPIRRADRRFGDR